MDGRRVFYVYDSYHIAASDWANILGKAAVSRDAVMAQGFFIALWLNHDGGELVSLVDDEMEQPE